MGIYYFNEIQILTFALVLLRVSAFFVAFPLVENAAMPGNVKILLSLVVTFVIYPIVDASRLTIDILNEMILVLALKEVLIGLIIGFIAKFFFYIISVCGEIITMSIGLSADQMFSPNMNRRVTVIEQFKLLLAGMFFLSLNGHHFFIQGVAESYKFVDISQIFLNADAFKNLPLVGQEIIAMGVKLSAPVLSAIFISNVAMGIVGRSVPQINVLITSWPINILLGLGVMFISLPLFMWTIKENLIWNTEVLFDLLKNF